MDALNVLLDIVATYPTARSMFDEVVAMHKRAEEAEERYYRELEEQDIYNTYHMSIEEYRDYCDVVEEEIKQKHLSDKEYDEYNNIYVESALNGQKTISNEDNQRNDKGRTDGIRTSGNGVLQEEQPDSPRGNRNVSENGWSEADDNGNSENAVTPEGEQVGYSITPATYVTKANKVLDMHLLVFDRPLGKEEHKSAREIAKSLRGWYDAKEGGYMMRSEEDAKSLANAMLDKEVVESTQPVSLSDVNDFIAEEPKKESKPTEVKPSNPSGNKLVTDERYAELRERMRKKLGGQMNMGIDPEILAIGTEMAVYHIEKGARKFKDYATDMIADLGDAIRPYLKAFYNGARELPEVEDAGFVNEMTPYEEVKSFDVANFDKAVSNPLDSADAIAKEAEVEKQAEEATEKIKDARNDKRIEFINNLHSGDRVILKDGRNVLISIVMHRGEQVLVNNAFGYTKPTAERFYATYKGESIDFTPDKIDVDATLKFREDLTSKTSKSAENSVPLQEQNNEDQKLLKSEENGLQRNDVVRTEGLQTDNNKLSSKRSRRSNNSEVQQDGGRIDRSRESGNERVGNEISQSNGRSVGRLSGITDKKNTRNNHSERGKDHAPTSVDARIEANIKAIELAKQLLENEEQATEKQMQTLRKFSGWGGLGKAFSEGNYYAPNPISVRLRELLGEEAYQQAVMSANSAYYTPAYVVDTLWDIAEQLGFKGGNILEGSAGIGNILGQMPTHISERSDIHAIEIDGTSGSILSLLYPDANVEIQGFEQTRIPNSSVDLAITNVPFVTGLRVNDTTGDKDLSKKFHNIHDFCIAKNVRKLREGGLGIFITSNGTLDNSKKLRDWIVSEGNSDFIGAFRLNNKTFGGTGVTSDIIVIRKRINGQKSANAIDVSTISGERTAEYNTGETRKVKGIATPIVKELSMDYNKYFIEHPENMAGEMYFAFEKGDTFRPTSKGLYPKPGKEQEQMLTNFVKSLKEDEFVERVDNDTKVADVNADKKIGELFEKDGKLYINNSASAQLLDVNNNKVKGHTKVECLKAYDNIKKALEDVMSYQVEHEDNKGLKPLLDKLNKAYDDFVGTYGHFNKNTAIAFLRNDVDYANVASIETYKELGDGKGGITQKFGKADVMSGRVIEKTKEPSPSNVKDGIIASVFKFGRIDVPYISEQLGRNAEEIKKEIIESGYGFEDPTTRQMEVAYQYLSGNVREKLRQAEENNENGEYDRNIKALQNILPIDIPAHLIDFTLGSSWINPKLYDEYVKEKTDIEVTFTSVGGTWFMDAPTWGLNNQKNRSMGVVSEKLGKVIMGHTLIEAAIQNKTISVSQTKKNYDGTTETITDKEATSACSAKIDEIRQDFKDWARQKMQTDSEMSAQIERTFNDMFNNYVPIEISEEFMPKYFDGATHKIEMRTHQKRAIVRGTMQPLLLAHEVGSGKTFTLISTAMEMRRLGTARKPMIVVQNATVGQFVASAKKLYPNAKILTLEDADRNAEGRKNFYAKIRYNDWDMIVVPQSTFEFIPDSEERQIAFIKDKIEEKMFVLERMQEIEADNNNLITRQAEKEIAQLEQQLAELSEETSKKRSANDEKRRAITMQNAEVKAMEMLDRKVDDVENFDDMGIDALLIDEAHEYKHLGFATAMQRGVKGVDPSYSKKSQGVFLKTQAVLENNNGRNVIFATGTPISNTAAEIWTFMRYLMPADTMKDYGIYYFDDFVRNFGNIQQMLEFSTSGKFKENNRFAGYVNLPELVRIWSGVADTVLFSEIEEDRKQRGEEDLRPEIEGGKAQDIYLPQTRSLRSVMKYVKGELEAYENMSGKKKRENSHIPLTMYGIAKAAAVDARLVKSDAEDDANSKTNEAVRQTLRSLKETDSYKGTVAIFADNYQNKHSGFNLYEDIRNKLIAEGVPANEVVVIKSSMSIKKKLEVFEKVNRGEVRVVLGSTFTLGTGVNIQERLHTIIHLDAPNRPMDYTQRNGRIHRQGNIHKNMGIPIRILRFGVEDSLDVTAYQRLKTKGAIADSIMNGKQMMTNSMTNRVLEEEEDVFGDTVAQLSGSEYAMLKNNAEKNVRKYESRKKQWEADQIYIHNAKPKLIALINKAKESIVEQQSFLNDVQSEFPNGKANEIRVGKQKFTSVEDMEDLIKSHNKSVRAESEKLKYGEISGDQTREMTISIGKYDFKITTVLKKETSRRGASLISEVHRNMTYSCPELGLIDVPVHQHLLRNAITDIVDNVITGKDFAEIIEALSNSIRKNESEVEQLLSREGKPFEYENELEQARNQYEEYTELMKAELAQKEAKYAEMDSDIETADNIVNVDESEDDVMLRDDGTLLNPDDIVKIEHAGPHGFNNFDEARQWAKKNIAKTYNNKETGGKGNIRISNKTIGKYLSESAEDKSDNRDVHLSVLKVLPSVIKSSVIAEQHPDYNKDVDGVRRIENGMNEDMNMHRLYGAVEIDGNIYRVKTTIKEDFTSKEAKVPHSYEVHKIELLAGTLAEPETRPNPNTNNSISLAKLLKNVEKSYIPGKLLIDTSNFRQGEGAYTDAEVSFANDLVSRAWGENLRSKKQQQSFANRIRKQMRQHAQSLAKTLRVPIEILDNPNGLTGKKARAKGFYDKKTGKATVILSNNNSLEDIEATVLHELVGHYGLRELFGENFDRFLYNVYTHAEADVKERINRLARKNNWDFAKATEEYLASLAEDESIYRSSQDQTKWILKIKRFFLDMLRTLGFNYLGPSLSDNELKYVLWCSYQNLQGELNPIFKTASDVAMQSALKVGQFEEQTPKQALESESSEFDNEPDVLLRDTEDSVARDMYERKLASTAYQATEAFQDSMLGLKVFQDAVLEANGKGKEAIADFENAYMAENALSSKNYAQTEEFKNRLFIPLVTEMARLEPSGEYGDLYDYMMAKHGLERNRVMAERDAEAFFENYEGEETFEEILAKFRKNDYAGLTSLTGEEDVESAEEIAYQMVEDYENSHNTSALWDKINACTADILKKQFEGGLISRDTYNQISAMYENYIPLRGWKETTADDVYTYLTSKSGAFNAPIRTARGRSSVADNPIATIAHMAESGIAQANRNKLKQQFYNFCLNNPSNLASISDVWLQHNPVTDEWEVVSPQIDADATAEEVEQIMSDFNERMKSLADENPDEYKKGSQAKGIPYKIGKGVLSEHQVLVKVNGKDIIITINGNPRAAQAVNGLTNPDSEMSGAIGNLLKLTNYVNRQLSAFYTTRNPEFVVSNFFRDAIYANSMVWVKESPNYAVKFNSNFGKVNPAKMHQLIRKYRNGSLDMSNEIEKAFYDFMINGGETGYTQMRDLEAHKKELDKALKYSQGKMPIRKAWNMFFDRCDEINRAVENCARFAAFVTSRQMGRTIQRSVYDAKEISVNFNKKGAGDKFLKSNNTTAKWASLISGAGRIFYVFWNAGIQGMANFAKVSKNNPKGAIVACAAMFVSGALVAMLGYDDEERDYYNLPEYVRRSNLCFKVGNSWVTIPLPIEYRAIYGLGELCASVINGGDKYTPKETAEKVAQQFSQLLPLDMLEGGGGWNPLIPTFAKPLAEAYVFNTDWTGLPIYKENTFNELDPEFTKAYKNANDILVGMSEYLNSIDLGRNGNAAKKGDIDINPAKLEYVLEGYFGGLATTFNKMVKMGETAFGDREFEWRNMLIASRLVKEGDERQEAKRVQNQYYNYKQEAEETSNQLRYFRGEKRKGILDNADELDFLHHSPEYLRYTIFNEYDEDITALNKKIKEMPDGKEKDNLVIELDALRKELVDQLNATRDLTEEDVKQITTTDPNVNYYRAKEEDADYKEVEIDPLDERFKNATTEEQAEIQKEIDDKMETEGFNHWSNVHDALNAISNTKSAIKSGEVPKNYNDTIHNIKKEITDMRRSYFGNREIKE